MIVDTSAIVAIVFDEPEAKALSTRVHATIPCRISAATLLECYVVTDRAERRLAGIKVDELVAQAAIAVEPVTVEHVAIARIAYQRFGRGSGHPARLNFGDCFAYALAKSHGEPLLYIGNDFTATDITAA